jgi:hypothetical protein
VTLRGVLHRTVQRILHRFDLHHMPAKLMPGNRGEVGTSHWCQWCGVRSVTWRSPSADKPVLR